ncbi:MAG: hypothetical protein WC637_14595 [Victivallales bacterium]|jgi:hypothetical protein
MRAMFVKFVIALLGFSCFAQSEPVNTVVADADVIAVVLGRKITVKEKDRVNGLIFSALLDQYAKDNKIEPTDEELDAFVKRTEEKEKQQLVKFEQDREKLRRN